MKNIKNYIQNYKKAPIFISSVARDQDLLDELYGSKTAHTSPFISSSERDRKLLKELYGKRSKRLDEGFSPEEIRNANFGHTAESHAAHQSLSHHYETHVKDHIGDHFPSLYNYTKNLSHHLNKHLLGMPSGEHYQGEDYSHHTHHIDSALRKSKLPHDLEVASGLGFDPRKHGLEKEGDTMHLKAYTSTTLKADKARMFSTSQQVNPEHMEPHYEKHHMVFHLKKNQNALYMSSEHNPISHHQEREFELLLPRDTHVRLLKHEVSHGPSSYYPTYHSWHVEVEPHSK